MKRLGIFIVFVFLLSLFVLMVYETIEWVFDSKPVLEIISGATYSPRFSWSNFVEPKQAIAFHHRVSQRFHAGMTRDDLVKRLSIEGFDVQKIFVADRTCYSEKCKKVEGVTYSITSYRGVTGTTWSIYWETDGQNDIVLYVDTETSSYIH